MSKTHPVWSEVAIEELPRLLVDGQDTGLPLWIATRRHERNKGLLGTDALAGALWIKRCNWVHCFSMTYPIDVVYLARSGQVLAVAPLHPGRLGMPRFLAADVVELELGKAQQLGITKGSRLSASTS